MNLFSDATRTARAELRAARRALEAAVADDRCSFCGGTHETDEFNDANDRVIRAEQALPWWKRIDIDLTAG